MKISEQVKAKDIADKPKVLAKQKQLLAERYKLDCRTQPSVTMTNGKPQPLGPSTHLKNGLTWDKLGALEAEEIKTKKLFPAGFRRLPHVKHEAGGMVFPPCRLSNFLGWSVSMWSSIFLSVSFLSSHRLFFSPRIPNSVMSPKERSWMPQTLIGCFEGSSRRCNSTGSDCW